MLPLSHVSTKLSYTLIRLPSFPFCFFVLALHTYAIRSQATFIFQQEKALLDDALAVRFSIHYCGNSR
jgi:hypothetical protein